MIDIFGKIPKMSNRKGNLSDMKILVLYLDLLKRVYFVFFGVYSFLLLDEILSRPVSWPSVYKRVFFGGLILFFLGQGIQYLKKNRKKFLKEIASKAFAEDPRLYQKRMLNRVTLFVIDEVRTPLSNNLLERWIRTLIRKVLEELAGAERVSERALFLLINALAVIEYCKALIIQNFHLPIEQEIEVDRMGEITPLLHDDEFMINTIFAMVVLMVSILSFYRLMGFGVPDRSFERRKMRPFKNEWLHFCSLRLSSKVFPPKSLRGEEFIVEDPFKRSFFRMLKGLTEYLKGGNEEALGRFVAGALTEQGRLRVMP